MQKSFKKKKDKRATYFQTICTAFQMTKHNKNPLLYMLPFHISFNFNTGTNNLLHKENAGYLFKPAGLRVYSRSSNTIISFNVDEMPQELHSCLYQLAYGKIGFIIPPIAKVLRTYRQRSVGTYCTTMQITWIRITCGTYLNIKSQGQQICPTADLKLESRNLQLRQAPGRLMNPKV